MKQRGKTYWPVLIMLIVLCSASWVYAVIPDEINYQGYLADSEDNPVNGFVSVQFSLYDDINASVSSYIWRETQNVEVIGGIYNVRLGAVNTLSALNFNMPYYLGVKVGADAEMTPRQPLTSVGYAFTADTALNVANNAVSSADVNFNYAGSNSKGGPATDLSCASCVSYTEIDPTVQRRIQSVCSTDYYIRQINADGTVTCEKDDLGITSETDPKIGTLSVGRWCATNGSQVNCIYEAPATANHNHDAIYVNVTGDTTTEHLKVDSSLRIQKDYMFIGGEGMELAYNESTNTGIIRSYDRVSGMWGNLFLGSGNVGIGTTTPTSNLTIQDSDPSITLNTTVDVATFTIQKNSVNRWSLAWNSGSGYLYFYDWAAPGGTRMVIDDDTGNVGIGVTSPVEKLVVAGNLRVQDSGDTKAYRFRTSGDALDFDFYKANMYFSAYDASNNQSILMLLHNSRKNVGIGTTNPENFVKLTVDSGTKAEAILALGDDIGVVAYGGNYDFYANGVGTNYGPFTGAHDVKLSADFPIDNASGKIVSVTGETQIRTSDCGSISLSSTLPTVALSKKANDKAVLGVLVKENALIPDHWYQPEKGERFGIVNALGEGRVWVTNINGEIEAGDYITTSDVPGYGQKQDDDLLHSYTLGKAIETIDWDSVEEKIQYNGQTYEVYLLAVVYTSG